MTTSKEYDHDLVIEEYYKKELTLNEKIEQTENGRQHLDLINFVANPNGLLVEFSELLSDISDLKLEGYRPSDKTLDFNADLKLNADHEALANRSLAKGIWKFTLTYNLGEKAYLVSKTINIK